MVYGKWWTSKLKMVCLLRRDLRLSKKGGDNMSDIRKPLEESIDDVRKGKLPNDTADRVHKLAHRHVMDRYADVAVENAGIRDEQLKKSVDAMKKVE